MVTQPYSHFPPMFGSYPLQLPHQPLVDQHTFTGCWGLGVATVMVLKYICVVVFIMGVHREIYKGFIEDTEDTTNCRE